MNVVSAVGGCGMYSRDKGESIECDVAWVGYVSGAIIMTTVIARVHPVHLVNGDWAPASKTSAACTSLFADRTSEPTIYRQ